MEKNKLLQQLAQSILSQKVVSNATVDFVMKQSRRDIKTLLSYLRSEYHKMTVEVTSARTLSGDAQKKIESRYQDKNIVYNINEKLGGGIIVRDNDDVYDFSARAFLNMTIEKLRA